MTEQAQPTQPAQPTKSGHTPKSTDRGNRRVVIGVVTSDKMNKTRRVEIPRLVKHPRYSKYIRRRTICHVHDERNESRVGDKVEIVESRPISKLKHWRLLRIVTKAPSGGVEVPATVETPTPANPT